MPSLLRVDMLTRKHPNALANPHASPDATFCVGGIIAGALSVHARLDAAGVNFLGVHVCPNAEFVVAAAAMGFVGIHASPDANTWFCVAGVTVVLSESTPAQKS